MKMDLSKNRWILTGIFLLTDIVLSGSITIEVQENSEVIISCPLTGDIQYPTWTGPEGLANPLTQGQTIQETGFEWVNSTDLKLAKAMFKHAGNYSCTDSNDNTAMVELDVQYFSCSADFTTATPDNTRTVFTCKLYSNPRGKIIPHIVTNIRPDDPPEKKNSTTTFHECVPDPLNENKTMCLVTSVMHVAKEDNGLEMSCEFIYKNSTKLTLFRKVDFQFPPTLVNITGNRPIRYNNQPKLRLTCATDSSNPVSSLVWRRGTSTTANQNGVISSNYQHTVMDAEYSGKNITQDIDIDVEESMNKEKVFCCGSNNVGEVCDFITIDYYVASAGCVLAKWMLTLLLVGSVYLTV